MSSHRLQLSLEVGRMRAINLLFCCWPWPFLSSRAREVGMGECEKSPPSLPVVK